MRLSYSSKTFKSGGITDTPFTDDSGRVLYATTSNFFRRKIEVLKYTGSAAPINLALLTYHGWRADTIVLRGQKFKAKDYLDKPSVLSRRWRFTTASGRTYEWHAEGSKAAMSLSFNGAEIGRVHSRSLGVIGSKHSPYVEVSDHADVLNDLDEIISTLVYLEHKREIKRNVAGAAAVGASA